MLLSVAALVLLTGVFFLQRSMFGGSSSAQPIQIAKSADPLDEAASVGHILLDQTHQEDQTVTSTRKNFESLGSVDIPVSSLITTATVLAEGYVGAYTHLYRFISNSSPTHLLAQSRTRHSLPPDKVGQNSSKTPNHDRSC